MIPYGHQSISKKDIDSVIKTLKSDWLTQGPRVFEFEKKLANYCGAKYAVAVNNGTSALYLAYKAAGFKKNDEVITTPNTFSATSNMMLACGAKPIFCDIRLDTYNIDESRIEKLITKKTKAIVPVHFAGQPCEMDTILKIAKKHKLIVIEDACHALGAKYKNKKIGGLKSDMTIFSFHPVKPITTGEGGAILTNNKKYYEKILLLRSHGIIKTKEKTKKYGPWYYEMIEPGFNHRITDIQCALGISQLEQLENFINKREKIAGFYAKNLKNEKKLILPIKVKNIRHGWHLFVIRLPKNKRREIFEKLIEKGVGVQAHYIPVTRLPYYKNLGYKTPKICEEYYNTCVTLPIYPGLSQKQLGYIIREIKKIISQNG